MKQWKHLFWLLRRQGLVFAGRSTIFEAAISENINQFSSLKTTTMKQIIFLFGSLLFVAVANAQTSKVTITASSQISKLLDKTGPTISAPVVSPVPSPVNLLAKATSGWSVAAPSQPAKSGS
jgi:hypothetical protein